MESIGDMLNQSPVIDLPGHSPIWRKETKVCKKCNREYVAFVASINGVDMHGINLCRACKQKEEEQERDNELARILPERVELQRERWEGSCGVPVIFMSKTFENFNRSLQPRAFDMTKNYRCQWDDDKPPESMILLSPNLYGVGKTHLVCAIINREIATREPARMSSRKHCIVTCPCPAHFITETKLLARIRATFHDGEGESENDIYKEMNRDSVLVIDDVGKVRPRDYSFLQGVYYRIIDSRYVSEQPTILTTNLDYSEFEEHIGGACADRLREMCGKNIIRLGGSSYRRKK